MSRLSPKRPPAHSRVIGVAIAIALAGSVLSCAPRIDNHGNEIDLDNLTEIEPGKTKKGRVNALLGAPSSTSDYGEETWFYIGSTTRTVGFLSPKLLDRKVVYIAFDENGVVDAIGKLSEDDGKKIDIVDRETPTAGQRITLLQQLIGNIGRFNEGAGGN